MCKDTYKMGERKGRGVSKRSRREASGSNEYKDLIILTGGRKKMSTIYNPAQGHASTSTPSETVQNRGKSAQVVEYFKSTAPLRLKAVLAKNS